MALASRAAEQLERGDVDAVADYGLRALGLTCLHPTVEDFVALVVALGDATDPEVRRKLTVDGAV